jgi:hypothetical protein
MLEFVQGSFLSAFPNTMKADQFVDKLDQQAGGVLSADERAQLIAMLGATPADLSKRAAVLRKVAEDPRSESERVQSSVCVDAVFWLPPSKSKRFA